MEESKQEFKPKRKFVFIWFLILLFFVITTAYFRPDLFKKEQSPLANPYLLALVGICCLGVSGLLAWKVSGWYQSYEKKEYQDSKVQDQRYSGRIELINNIVHYTSEGYGSWEIPLSEIRVIGEHTNQEGPWRDDYFFVYVINLDGWYRSSFYAEGRDEFLDELSKKVGYTIELELLNSADYLSNVLWPAELKGKPLFNFYKKRDSSFWGKWLRTKSLYQELDKTVIEYFKSGFTR